LDNKVARQAKARLFFIGMEIQVSNSRKVQIAVALKIKICPAMWPVYLKRNKGKTEKPLQSQRLFCLSFFRKNFLGSLMPEAIQSIAL
jgi:hypothetical protein